MRLNLTSNYPQLQTPLTRTSLYLHTHMRRLHLRISYVFIYIDLFLFFYTINVLLSENTNVHHYFCTFQYTASIRKAIFI